MATSDQNGQKQAEGDVLAVKDLYQRNDHWSGSVRESLREVGGKFVGAEGALNVKMH